MMQANAAAHKHASQQARKSYLIDISALHAHTLGNMALEHDMLALFLRQSTRLLLEFNAASSVEDWRFYARALKGSALNIGATEVANAAQNIESCDFSKGYSCARDHLAALEAAVLGTNDCIRDHVRQALAKT